MSGHSKWSQIKRQKAKTDVHRGKVFSKIIREIQVAVRQAGPDPAGNPRLRLVIEKAKEVNMPGDNIDRAIKKASGSGEDIRLEELVYEGYGPSGAAIIVTTLTDNRNRTSSDLRTIFGKHNGNLGEAGCVAWLFTNQGIISFEKGQINEDELLNLATDAGASDVRIEEKNIEVITTPHEFEKIRNFLNQKGFKPAASEISMIATNTVSIENPGDAEKILKLMDALEDNDDVNEIYSNFIINDEVLRKLGKL